MTALAFGRENKQDFVCLSLTGAALARPGSDCLFCPLSPQPLELNNPALEQRVSTRSPSLGLVTWQPSCSTLAGLARAGLRPSGCHLPQVSPCPAAAFFFFFSFGKTEVLPISSPGFGYRQEILTFSAGGRKWMKF